MEIYTDGSCKLTKIGAYGFITVINNNINTCFVQRVEKTSNNKMEILAMYSALSYINKKNLKNVTIHCDSKYVVDGYTEWMFKWQSNGWKTAKNKNVLNRDLWEKLIMIQDNLNKKGLNPKVKWVKAHSSNKYNNYVDKIVQNILK